MILTERVKSDLVIEELDHDQRCSRGHIGGHLCCCIEWYILHLAKLILKKLCMVCTHLDLSERMIDEDNNA